MVLRFSSPGTAEFWELPILYEDEHLLAVDKPAGLLAVADATDLQMPNLLGFLHQAIAEAKPWAAVRGLSFLMCPYRLDAEASGVLLLAKSKPVLTRLSDVFGAEIPCLSFVTLVRGDPREDRFTVDAKLAPHPTRSERMHSSFKSGKRSRSQFEVKERFDGWTLLKCAPLTHRRHQLRAHLAYRGFPIAGDPLYGGRPLLLSRLKPGYHLKPNRSERPLISSPCLHLERVELNHPVTNQPVVIEAPWPKDLTVAVKYLRKWAPPNPRLAKVEPPIDTNRHQ